MRILLVSDVYFPRVNGVSTSIQTFRQALGELGHHTALIAPAYPSSWPDEPGTLRVASRRVPLDPEDRMMHAAPIRALLPRLARERFDLVHVQTPFVAHYLGLWLARQLGVPCVETYHTFFEEYLFHYVPFLPRALMRAAARRFSRAQGNSVDALVVPSSAMGEVLAGYGVRAPMAVIPTGIPLADFGGGTGLRFRQAMGIAPEAPLLLFVGRVAHEKNIGFLLEALGLVRQRVPGALLAIAGEGPALPALRRQAHSLGLAEAVRFAGYLDRRGALLDCYAAADAFVFASRTETQGLVLLEAMALGIPVVSTAVMGTRDVVGPGRGALVPGDEPADFAAAVVRLLEDPALRARLCAEARDYVQEWQAGALARRMAGFYEGVLREAAPGASPVPG
ncbi:MAG: glycosyltransferase [Betaproteobacteria bacterium]|jgi:1,2-diacylglycerol 3-alpha-glucosyltransferase|nr:glycosyltransferase [Betaproteobacteria bacterium]